MTKVKHSVAEGNTHHRRHVALNGIHAAHGRGHVAQESARNIRQRCRIYSTRQSADTRLRIRKQNTRLNTTLFELRMLFWELSQRT